MHRLVTTAVSCGSIALIAVFLLTTPSFAAPDKSAWSGGLRARQTDDLADLVINEGRVRLIVKLAVPDLERLTAASAAYGTFSPGENASEPAASADRALAGAIGRVVDSVLAQLAGTAYSLNHRYASVPFLALEVSAGSFEVLSALPEVVEMKEDLPVPLALAPAPRERAQPTARSSLLPPEPNLSDTVTLIGASAAWAMGHTGSGWYVAILDTGIRKTHEFFAGKTIVEACYALGEDGIGPAGDCPNGLSSMQGSGAAEHHSSTYEGWDHGTHVSGIAAGNTVTLKGVAKDSGLIAVQVFSKFSAGACGGSPCVMSYDSDQLAGLDYVYSIRTGYSIAAVNMSLGGGHYTATCDGESIKPAIDNLLAAGIGTVIATGNDGFCDGVGAPSCISSALAIGSSTKTDEESSFNNYHPTLQELFAPGSSIYSATGSSDTSYDFWDGTSMATPHVAGSLALMRHANPTATVAELFAALDATGAVVVMGCSGSPPPIPRVQVDAAIESLPEAIFLSGFETGDTSEWSSASP